jgi:hypothetical protein
MTAHIGTLEKKRSLERELALRVRVYPRRVEAGAMTQEKADREIAVMEAVLADYSRQLAEETQRERLL